MLQEYVKNYIIFLLLKKELDFDNYSKREDININFNLNNNNSLLHSFECNPNKYIKTIKYSSLNKENKFKVNKNISNINISPKTNKSLRNNNNIKNKQQKKKIMNIIQKRLNNTNLRNTNISNLKEEKLDSIKKIKKLENNNINNTINTKNNIILSNILKNKKNQKNKKVKLVGISYQNNKDKIKNINSINNSKVNSPNKPKSLKKMCDKINNNNFNGYTISNYKKNIVHRHTKSSFNQDTQLLSYFKKDMNNSENINLIDNNNKNEIKDNYIKNNKKNNYLNYSTKFNMNRNTLTNKNTKLNKIHKNKKNEIKNNLINHNRENSDKGGLIKIIEELKINNKEKKSSGLTNKFINAQNNWRKNYFATVIQKIFRGYHFRKSDYKQKYSNKNINSIYIRKKAKDNKIYWNQGHHRKCPTEENLNFICQNINKKYSNNLNEPPKIKEIVIVKNIKKDINNPFKYSNFYFNNYIYNYNEPNYNQSNYQIFLYKLKYIFDAWKEFTDKKKIVTCLKNMKKYDKKIIRYYSDEKKNKNNNNNNYYYNNYNRGFIKQFLI